MIARGSGAIVNISTMYASVGVPFAPVAAATKAALESFTGPGGGVRRQRDRVNTVAPGPTRTDGAVGALADGLEQLGSATPLGRTADPSEIAEAIVSSRRHKRATHGRDRAGGRRLYRDLTNTRANEAARSRTPTQ